jgi:hypothetical protein
MLQRAGTALLMPGQHTLSHEMRAQEGGAHGTGHVATGAAEAVPGPVAGPYIHYGALLSIIRLKLI